MKKESITGKNIIILTARVHPGESVSSYVMKGIIDRLLDMKDEKWGQYLRDNYMFVIVPILNIDGVSIGNSRCSLAGNDLNDMWYNPDRFVHPEIYYSKKLVYSLKKNNDIVFFGDIHGNASNSDFFLYGFSNRDTKSSKDFSLSLSNHVELYNSQRSK